MDTRWVKVESWHAIEEEIAGEALTLCGLRVGMETARDTLPAEKSCETCLRILTRRNDDDAGVP